MVKAEGAVLVAGSVLPVRTMLMADVASAVCSRGLPAPGTAVQSLCHRCGDSRRIDRHRSARSTSSGVVRITGIALGWMAPTSAFGSVVRNA